MSNIFDVIDIEDKLSVTFSDKTVLKEAFTHSSYANEKKVKSNENLEFLGDSVLGFIVSEYLYNKFPSVKEGELSVMRSTIVSAKPLHDAVVRMKLQEHLFLGAGESRSESNKLNVYADLFEAIVAAVYLDGGIAAAKKFVMSALGAELTSGHSNRTEGCRCADNKTTLQELIQRDKGTLKYEQTARSGPDHDPLFTFAVYVNGKKIATGTGKSKREAQQAAAGEALKKLR